ncbi:hypothetical protein CRENBAI_005270 [Crenichthys baileyi]|uniref:Uncharacterized protein n=1 Tax=Crenichthys baileyi TaxID=28760 RepID=A0AAV9QX90_9TELE
MWLAQRLYPVTQTRREKYQTTTKPRRLLMTQLSWQTEETGGENPIADVSIEARGAAETGRCAVCAQPMMLLQYEGTHKQILGEATPKKEPCFQFSSDGNRGKQEEEEEEEEERGK